MRGVIILFSILLIPFITKGQGGFFIENNANVVITEKPQIIINNGKLKNDGDLSAGEGTICIFGNNDTENSTIGGSSTTIFNHLEINKNNNDTRLDYDIEIDGDLIMNGGNLILNKSDIILGGNIKGETAAKRITGTEGGAIIKTIDLNAPLGENPGNLGLEITSTENMGSTTIQRSHVQLTNNGNRSIFRHFNISPTNNANLDATLRINYFEEELDGLTEGQLKIWQYDGVNWSDQNMNSFNIGENWVEAQDYSFFHTVAVAEEMSLPLPIELIDFKARATQNKEVEIYWSTANEFNNDYFIVERSQDGLFFEKISIVKGAGNSNIFQDYKIIDPSPFNGINYYRLKQVDFNGSYSYSPIRSVEIISEQSISVYPVPMNNELNISGIGNNSESEAIISIYDASGKVVYKNTLSPENQTANFKIKEVSKLIPGNYFLTIQIANEKMVFNLVKAEHQSP